MRIVIVSPPYDENSGGSICLHTLCHYLRLGGVEAFLCPRIDEFSSPSNRIVKNLFIYFLVYLKFILRNYGFFFKVNKSYHTPVLKAWHISKEEDIVLYSESIQGNPFRARQVVRWLLHQPGFHMGKFYYYKDECIVRFNSAIKKFSPQVSFAFPDFLKIVKYPLDSYKNENRKRSGICYSVRKAKNYEVLHDSQDKCIDGLSHEEINNIFNNSVYFLSYDPYSAYSILALFSGCISVVAEQDAISKFDWYPDDEDRLGIAYGFDDIKWAVSTSSQQIERVLNEEARSADCARDFFEKVTNYFIQRKS